MKQAKEAVDEARIIPSNSSCEAPLTITSDTLLGQQQETILAQSEDWNADLIVLGSRGLGGVTRLLLGSVSSAVLSHANCSVEIARQGTQPEVKFDGIYPGGMAVVHNAREM